MHHRRASDIEDSPHFHSRASDRQRWRLDIGHLLTLATTLISTLVLVLSTYYTLKAQVDLHADSIHRLESTAKSKESADSDLKVVLTKLEELDRRLTERLTRIEANQNAGSSHR